MYLIHTDTEYSTKNAFLKRTYEKNVTIFSLMGGFTTKFFCKKQINV